MIYSTQYISPLGKIMIYSDGKALTGLYFDEQKYYDKHLYENACECELPVFAEAKRWLDIYFSGKEPDFFIPVKFDGTPFQKEVWNILCHIPYGSLMTYGEIANKIAERRGIKRMSAQAVGGAVGRNKISIIVPCHRVIGSDGSLTGYAGGTWRKQALLGLEKTDI